MWCLLACVLSASDDIDRASRDLSCFPLLSIPLRFHHMLTAVGRMTQCRLYSSFFRSLQFALVLSTRNIEVIYSFKRTWPKCALCHCLWNNLDLLDWLTPCHCQCIIVGHRLQFCLVLLLPSSQAQPAAPKGPADTDSSISYPFPAAVRCPLLCLSSFLTCVRTMLIFSERELMFMFAICYRPSVCLSSVCLSVVCRL